MRKPSSSILAGVGQAIAAPRCGTVQPLGRRLVGLVGACFAGFLGMQPLTLAATVAVGEQLGPGDCVACAWSACVGCMMGPDIAATPACEQCDLTGDNDVDLGDVASFLHAFGERPPCRAVCGNGVLEAGEACDPPNGVTCDANCQIVNGGGLSNDSCQSPIAISECIRSFSNIGATTDGPDEPTQCVILDYSHIDSDIWYCYTATETDVTVVSLCCSAFDTKMAVYSGCDCTSRPMVACSDDDCGTGTTSRVTFPAVAGESYLIRIGGFEGEQGTGEFSIYASESLDFGLNSCGAGAGACFTDDDVQQGNGTPGCEDVDVCMAVCDLDPCCCDTAWDGLCAQKAKGIVEGFDACGAGNGDCLNSNGSPGCDNADCCNDVCKQDPFCCLNEWDQQCAESVGPVCGVFAVCETAVGNCFAENATVGCDIRDCCNLVCDFDAFCCLVDWDDLCVDHAGNLCRG